MPLVDSTSNTSSSSSRQDDAQGDLQGSHPSGCDLPDSPTTQPQDNNAPGIGRTSDLMNPPFTRPPSIAIEPVASSPSATPASSQHEADTNLEIRATPISMSPPHILTAPLANTASATSLVTPTARRLADMKAGLSSTEQSKKCCTSNGRNISVSFDGTLGEFGVKNSNVIEFHGRIIKDESQLSNYISGIGTRGSSKINRKIDSAIAMTFQRGVLMGYEWLCNHYEPGDRIFLFGFSWGAYQARVVAGMIERVGLLYKGINSQLPSVFKLYMETMEDSTSSSIIGSVSKPQFGPKKEFEMKASDARRNNAYTVFKKAFSRPGVKVHFVGAWDTVSSIGIGRKQCFPETVDGMTHVCHFRHALALDERRVRFWPEYANTNAPSSGAERGDIKEVWFAGSHSDIGGGRIANPNLANFGPALRWMTYEAMVHGLRMEQCLGPWKNMETSMSLKGMWWNFLEILPLHRPSGMYGERMTRVPHLGAPRRIHEGQKIHESVFEKMRFKICIQASRAEANHNTQLHVVGAKADQIEELSQPLPVTISLNTKLQDERGLYVPQAIFQDTAITWKTVDLLQERIEADYFSSAHSAVRRLREAFIQANGEPIETAIAAMGPHVFSGPRSKSLAEVPGILDLLLLILSDERTRDIHDSESSLILFSALAQVPSQRGHDYPLHKFRSLAKRWKISERIYRPVVLHHANGLIKAISTNIEGSSLEYIAFSSDQTSVICGSYEEVATWDLSNGTKQTISYGTVVETVEITADGSQFVTGSGDGKVEVWDMDRKEVTQVLHGHTYAVTIVTLSGDGKIASGSSDGSIRIWKFEGGSDLFGAMDRHWGPIWELAFSSSSTRLVSGGRDETVRVWDTSTGDHLLVLRGHTDDIWSVAYSPDDKYIISGSADTTICVWDAQSGACIRILKGHKDTIMCLAFSRDGRLIASGGGFGDRTLRVWDASSGDVLAVNDVGIRLRSLAFSPDNKRLIVGCAYGEVSIWDAELIL